MKIKFSFAFTILMGLALVFTSCSRQQGAVSYNSEKLQKQSAEIENSKYSASANQSAEENLSASNEETAIVASSTTYAASKAQTASKIEAKLANKKMSVAQKIALKKISKKLSPDQKFDSKGRSGLDHNLKLAIIFAIAAIIAGLFSWWLGTILIIIALVFFLIWAVENL